MHYMRSTAVALVAAFVAVQATAQDRQVIRNASDIPPLVIELPQKPSELALGGGAGYESVKDKVEAHATDLLTNYDIQDKATQKQLRQILLTVARVENRWADVLRLVDELAALEDKPGPKAMSGLVVRAYARAALAVGEEDPRFREAFRGELEKAVAALDWTVAEDGLQAMHGQFQVLNRDVLVGSLQGALDANAQAQNLKVGFNLAAGVVGARLTLIDMIPLKDLVFAVLDKRVKGETPRDTRRQDRWTSRLVELKPADVKAPVTIAIWDGGFDPQVFTDRLWRNPGETANGRDDDGNGFVDDIHGLAFDTDYGHSTGALRPMPAEDLRGLQDSLNLVKGSLDLRAAVDSAEARAFRQKMSLMKADEVVPFSLQLARISLYLHGTATGFTSSEGNPGARLMHARFDSKIELLPEPIDEAAGEAMARYVRETVAYYKANGVRVVNMSWRITEPLITATLANIEPDPLKRKARAKAVFDMVNRALEESFRAAPEILFVAGAGNEDQDVDFVRSFPAGINLPNVVTVGAVDVALEPTGFTSYGASIDLYANGFEVPSKVPGGMPINISGTSLAAPQVTNLAGKILAINPKLTIAQVRAIIEETATAEGPRGFKVIDPAAAIERARRS